MKIKLKDELEFLRESHRKGIKAVKNIWNLSLYLRKNAQGDKKPSFVFCLWVSYWVVMNGPEPPRMGHGVIR